MRLYNVLFPIWMLTLMPSFWLISIPVNFVVDSAALLIILTVLAKKRGEATYRPWRDWLRAIWLTWILGFISDLVAAGFLIFWGLGPTMLLGDRGGFISWWGEHVATPMMENPFGSIFAVLFVLAAIGLGGLLIYFFNKNVALRMIRSLEPWEIRRAAFWMAVVTAPWTMLVPSRWFW